MKKHQNSSCYILPILLLALATQAVECSVFRFLSPKINLKAQTRALQQNGTESNALGSYTIEKSPNPKGCEDEEKISYDDETFAREIKNMKLFSFARSAVDSWVKTQDEGDFKGKIVAAAFIIATSAITLVLSVIFFIVFLIYFFCNCLCKICPCCKKASFKDYVDKPGDTEEKKAQNLKGRSDLEAKIRNLSSEGCRKCIMITSLVLTIIITGVGIAWVIFVFKSISGVEKTRCSVHYSFEKIKVGVNSSEFQFAGLKGMKFLLGAMVKSLDSIQSSNLQSIIDQDLEGKADQALSTLQPFYNGRLAYQTESCNVNNPNPVTPDFILDLTVDFNSAVKAEFDAMKKNGADLTKSARDGLDAITTSKAEYNSMLEDFNMQIDDFINSITTQ